MSSNNYHLWVKYEINNIYNIYENFPTKYKMKIIHKQARKNAFTRHQKVKYIFLSATILKHMYRDGKVSC